jgi:hypothetical protein
MTRYTNIFAHPEWISIFPYHLQSRPINGLQNVSLNFNPAVKFLLNWRTRVKAQGSSYKAQEEGTRFKVQGSRTKAQEV